MKIDSTKLQAQRRRGRVKVRISYSAFTLIEVLIALLIIAIALAAAIRATNQSIRASIHVRNMITAHWVGLNILSEIQTHSGVSLSGIGNVVSGQTQMLGQKWTWHAEAESVIQIPSVTRVVVVVELKNKRITSVTGYV